MLYCIHQCAKIGIYFCDLFIFAIYLFCLNKASYHCALALLQLLFTSPEAIASFFICFSHFIFLLNKIILLSNQRCTYFFFEISYFFANFYHSATAFLKIRSILNFLLTCKDASVFSDVQIVSYTYKKGKRCSGFN